MKKYIVFIAALVLASATANALPWTGDYELDNGMKITRTPTNVKVQAAGLTMEMSQYKFGKGSVLGKSCAKEEGCLSIALSAEQFVKEVSKLGKITKTTIK